jgi:hypothetical protein
MMSDQSPLPAGRRLSKAPEEYAILAATTKSAEEREYYERMLQDSRWSGARTARLLLVSTRELIHGALVLP